MKPRPFLRFAVLVAIILESSLSATAEKSDPIDPWELSRRYQFNEAVDAFSSRVRVSSSHRDSDALFGLAVNLLNRQPKTAGNIERSRRILQEIQYREATSDLGIAARYFLGRIAQLHLQKPDIHLAIKHFRFLVENHPEHFWGQVAATKYGFLRLYRVMPKEERRALFIELETLAEGLSSLFLRSNFHFMLGTAAVRFRMLPERALDHFIQAEKLGLIKGRARTDGLLRIGELARKLGHWEVAEKYYRRYLDEFRRDPPRDLVSDRLEEARRMQELRKGTLNPPAPQHSVSPK